MIKAVPFFIGCLGLVSASPVLASPRVQHVKPAPAKVRQIDMDLLDAVENRETAKVAVLLNKGANPNAMNGSALEATLSNSDCDDARLLILHGANFAKYRMALLNLALSDSFNKPLFEVLKARGGLPKRLAFSQFGTAYSAQAIRIILAAGGNPNEPPHSRDAGVTILDKTILNGDVEAVRALLEAGANIESKAECSRGRTATGDPEYIVTGATPLFFAVQTPPSGQCSSKMVELLLTRGANPNSTETTNGFSPLMWAALWSGDDPDILKLLLKAGAKIDATDTQGRTALHLSAYDDESECVKALLQFNHTPAFLETRDKEGLTALQLAMAPAQDYGHWTGSPAPSPDNLGVLVPTVAALVNGGADVNVRDDEGQTLFHRMADFSSSFSVPRAQFLVKNGYTLVDAKDNQGRTPLFVACQLPNLEFASYLLNSGADPDAHTNDGTTPRQIAMQEVHTASLSKQKDIIEAQAENDKGLTGWRKEILALMNKLHPVQKAPAPKD